jgi:hypothetical protein
MPSIRLPGVWPLADQKNAKYKTIHTRAIAHPIAAMIVRISPGIPSSESPR